MKKLLVLTLTIVLCLFALDSCGCDHVYDNDCDSECNTEGCEETRETEHDFAPDCKLEICDICGFKRTASHEYSNVCDTECNECGELRTAPRV